MQKCALLYIRRKIICPTIILYRYNIFVVKYNEVTSGQCLMSGGHLRHLNRNSDDGLADTEVCKHRYLIRNIGNLASKQDLVIDKSCL